jgi:ribose-phosphate pyrophosphokinase
VALASADGATDVSMDKSLICTDDSSKKTDPYGELKVFAGSSSRKLGQAICSRLGMELAQSETMCFSEGNVFVRVLENVRGRDVFIIQGIDYPVNDNFVELLFWIDAFKRASAMQVTAVIPYFSYAKGDKKDEPRVSIRARVCADCIEAAGADRVLTMDLHSPQIQGFFKIPVDHLYAMPVLVDYFRSKKIPDLVVAAPDVGFGKQAYKFGEMMNAPVVFGNKTRRGHDEKAEMLDIVGQVEGKNVLIVDDFTITGGTLIEMAVECKRRGARDVYACVSHGVFSQGSAAKIEKSPIKELVLTDTIEHRFEPLASCCKVVSIAGLFADAILSIHRRESVSRLFNYRGDGR